MDGRHRRNNRTLLLAGALAAGLCVVVLAVDVLAEVVDLRDGRRIVGRCRANEKTVTISRGLLKQYIPRASIERVELLPGERKEFDGLKQRLEPRGARGFFDLAEWLDDHLQFDEADGYYEKVIAASPDHQKARRALGYRKVGGKWRADPSRQLQRALKGFGPSAARKLMVLVGYCEDVGNLKAAERACRQVLVRDPHHVEALRRMLRYLADYKPKHAYRRPVEGKWIAVGGHHHQGAAYMLNAIDLSKVGPDGRLNKGRKLEDWYSFGAEVRAAAAGKVFAVKDEFPDSPVGRPGDFLKANYVCIDHGRGEFTLYAHLKNGSIKVSKGRRVKAGQLLGLVGNSGSSGSPHLHFCLYDRDGISLPITFTDEADEKKDAGKGSKK